MRPELCDLLVPRSNYHFLFLSLRWSCLFVFVRCLSNWWPSQVEVLPLPCRLKSLLSSLFTQSIKVSTIFIIFISHHHYQTITSQLLLFCIITYVPRDSPWASFVILPWCRPPWCRPTWLSSYDENYIDDDDYYQPHASSKQWKNGSDICAIVNICQVL